LAALERDLAAAKARAQSETKKDANPASPPAPTTPYVLRLKEALGEAQTDLKILRAEETRLRSDITTYQARVENVPRREQEFKELSRDYDSTRELYSSLMNRYEDAQLAAVGR